MTALIRRPGLVQLPNVTPLQRRTIIYELDIRRRTYDNYGRIYRDRAAIARATELADIIRALENHE